ncbi:MAG: GTPase ObgE [Bacilli bacterium]
MFVDSVKIHVKAGNGGNGVVAFRHEKYANMGGPSGGKGGRGGDVILVGEEGLTTLLDFRFTRKICATNGQNGMQKDMYGRDGDNAYAKVPIGTTIINAETGVIIGDITKHGQEVIVAHGGRGGKGNAAFANSRNTAPEICEKGEPGEELMVQLELKVLADVGLVGFPSVGKSTLITMVSKATPKIAEYHFTTLNPHLGVVGVKDGRSFIMADLPGLIEGAHLGAGLGIQFLKHIERTRVIVHIVDMSGIEGRNPIDDYLAIRKELGEYDPKLLERPEIVVANKMDLTGSEKYLKEFEEKLHIDVIPISAISKQNLDTLLYKIADVLDEAKKTNKIEESQEEVVEYTFTPPSEDYEITRDDSGVYHVDGPIIKKLFDRTDFNNESNVRIFAQKLRKLGVDEKLRKLGVKHGDTVCILGYEFEMYE